MLYIIPQFPVLNRYPEDWIRWLDLEFSRHYKGSFEILMGLNTPKPYTFNDINKFTDTESTISYELQQLDSLFKKKLLLNDLVLFCDFDFPGFSSSAAFLLRTLYPTIKLYGFIHATSVNYLDFWNLVSDSKFFAEKGSFSILDGIFVATNYHKNKLSVFNVDSKIYVVGCPFFSEEIPNLAKDWLVRKWDIFIPARHVDQKLSGVDLDFAKVKISDGELYSRKHYYETMGNSKICLSLAQEETFGYSVLEAISLGAIPVVPDKYSYPELVSEVNLRYSNFSDMKFKINSILNGEDWVDYRIKLNCDLFKWENSFKNLISILEGN